MRGETHFRGLESLRRVCEFYEECLSASGERNRSVVGRGDSMRVRTETATPEYELVALHGCAGAIRKRSMKRRACCRTADRGCSSRRCAAGCIIACTGSRFRTAIRYLHVSLSLLVRPDAPPCECFVCCVHPPHVRTIRHAPHADGHRQAYTVYSKLAMDTMPPCASRGRSASAS